MLKGKASAAVAVGLRNADVLKNWVVKHQFLSESTIQDMATLILFPSPPPSPQLELGIFWEAEI